MPSAFRSEVFEVSHTALGIRNDVVDLKVACFVAAPDFAFPVGEQRSFLVSVRCSSRMRDRADVDTVGDDDVDNRIAEQLLGGRNVDRSNTGDFAGFTSGGVPAMQRCGVDTYQCMCPHARTATATGGSVSMCCFGHPDQRIRRVRVARFFEAGLSGLVTDLVAVPVPGRFESRGLPGSQRYAVTTHTVTVGPATRPPQRMLPFCTLTILACRCLVFTGLPA